MNKICSGQALELPFCTIRPVCATKSQFKAFFFFAAVTTKCSTETIYL